ncbi:TolC family outer membrane protein [Paracoccus jiaweipingae]|uniref:TolC family outer membrane protein n=1 Tax=unclassified Paracoccus (in: a-proteobacteria) TaxID=2688777 RepID=UPI0037BC959A
MFRSISLRTRLTGAIAAATLAITPVAALAESLGDALVSAYRNSSLLDQNRAVLRAADEDVASAIAALRPVVKWAASHSYTNIEGGIDQRSTSLQFQAQMTLYDFGRSQLAIDIAKETVLATREELIGIEQDVLLGAVKAYLDVISAAEQVDLQQNSVRVIGQEQRASRDRFEVGEITVTDVSQADARLAATRAALVAAQGRLEVANEAYKAAVGHKPGKLSGAPKAPKAPPSLAEAQRIAQRTHPVIRQLQRQVTASELAVAAAAAERNPTIGATAGIGGTRAPVRELGGAYKTTGTAQIGIEMSQTLYSGGRLPAVHRKAMAQRDSARAALLHAGKQVAQAVGTAWANIDVARAQIKAINQQISAAQQAYDGVREEATLGARTTLDVLDAEQELLSARADKISAQTNLQLANYQLLAAMGLLTVENLKLGVPQYDPSAYYNAVRNAPYTSRQGESLDRVLRAIGKN